jgi:superfamily II DNA or RNA helicase
MAKKIQIEVNNNVCQLYGDRMLMHEAYKAFKVRNPNAFFLRKYMPRGWDGKQDYIRDNGKFPTGLLTQVYEYFVKTHKITPELRDERNIGKKKFNIPTTLNGFKPRDYQRAAVESILNNKIGDLPLPIGVLDLATNAGKTLVAALLYRALGSRKTILLINSIELYEQALVELPQYLGDSTEIGTSDSKGTKWGNLMVLKVKTASLRCDDHDFRNRLASYEVAIIDECDLADNKTYKTVLRNLYNTWVKVGMSGSIYLSKLAKDKLKNQNLRGFFGEKLSSITNRELIDKGHSSEVKCIFNEGNTSYRGESWPDEYLNGIIKNKERNLKVYKRVKRRIKRGEYPLVIVIKEHKHLEILLKLLRRKLGDTLIIEGVHHETPNRTELVNNFKDGKIDILIASMILKRGKNFPLMRGLINAAGGDSPENFVQILGRAMRKGKNKNKKEHKYYEDFFDEGRYLKRHSKHRVSYAKNQKLKVLENYKK